ncbi:MAG: 2,3-bisphosphoglycerate-independent phosphoglycerate mutase, partial [Gammaproteobacteria bacterium]
MKRQSKPVVLLILDGFGYSESSQSNAIKVAKTPTWDGLWANYSHTLIDCSGEAVGLPDGQMGNSEVGHVHLGAGRLMPQDFTRINNEIKSGDFYSNQVLCDVVDSAIESGGALHLLGLLSPGGVHSHEEHIAAMLELAAKRGLQKIYLHAFLDGRDTPPKSAEQAIQKMETKFAELGCGRMASLVGR